MAVELKAPGSIAGRKCQVTIDTGSNITLVRPDIMRRPGKELTLQPMRHQWCHRVWIADITDECILRTGLPQTTPKVQLFSVKEYYISRWGGGSFTICTKFRRVRLSALFCQHICHYSSIFRTDCSWYYGTTTHHRIWTQVHSVCCGLLHHMVRGVPFSKSGGCYSLIGASKRVCVSVWSPSVITFRPRTEFWVPLDSGDVPSLGNQEDQDHPLTPSVRWSSGEYQPYTRISTVQVHQPEPMRQGPLSFIHDDGSPICYPGVDRVYPSYVTDGKRAPPSSWPARRLSWRTLASTQL